MKKLIAFLLAAVFCLSFFSCAKKQSDRKGDKPEDESVYIDHLPGLDFGGQKLTFAHSEGTNGTFTSRSVKVDEQTGDMVDDKLYEKTQSVENRLNIEIEDVLFSESSKEFHSAIVPYLEAQDSSYDIIVGFQYFDLPLATEGYILDYNTIPAEQNHVDLTAPYWAKDYIDSLSYNGKTFWLTGDIALRYIAGVYSVFVNARLYDQYLKETYGSIYDVVRNGEWTLDKLHEMAKRASSEDATGKLTKKSEVIGFYKEGGNSSTTTAFAASAGLEWSIRQQDGSVEFLFNQNYDKLVNVISKMYSVFSDESAAYVNEYDYDDVESMKQFQSGNVVFIGAKLFTAELYLREMTDDFCIIPMPKYDEASGYRTLTHDGCSVFGISWASENVEACTAALELMAAESMRLVTPAYYDSALKYKYTRDDDSAEMIDIIRDSVYVDFALAWDRLITENWIKNAINANPRSNIKKRESIWIDNFNALLKSFEK